MAVFWAVCLLFVDLVAGLPLALSATSSYLDSTLDGYVGWPTYAELPLNSSYPTKAAWGVWGSDDELGALNHITKDTILAASREIQLGRIIPLNLRLDALDPPVNPDRKPLTHLFQPGQGYTDDVLILNTQISTQYDGLRHFAYSTENDVATYQWYNDLIKEYEEVIGPARTETLGIHVAAEKGIGTRGVLLDWAGWMDAKNESFDAFTERKITVTELDEVAHWQGLSDDWSRPGDMLVVRTGWLMQYTKLGEADKALLPLSDGHTIGLEASDATLQWLWEKKFSLVGADNPALESVGLIRQLICGVFAVLLLTTCDVQTPFDGMVNGEQRSLHEILIAGWGQSIVEFLELESLAVILRQSKRCTFFVTVQNLNVYSGIASPPNALAII